ncbi:TIGR01777 family protein [Georgenia yuyongxinii]|uniref:TIGR01777 family protein n=1 Tax=Georgenia yuyongxinii TaxID=2589797 RepID=A0A5B8C7V8_9MICO|nr:TIGR01777 family oxidoreductase [Georgenia yuyongxinii]QDC26177.1 TIGR01777 family protein [Georgenia yuyongxinii]
MATMAVFERTTVLPHPRDEVFAWFERPGALVRLSPPFGGSVLAEPSDGIRDGSVARLGIGAPGVLGAGLGALARAVPWPDAIPARLRRPELDWTARHDRYDPPRMFRDTMVRGPMGHWVHTHRFDDSADGGTAMTDHVAFGAPGEKVLPGRAADIAARAVRPSLERIFAYRAAQVRADLDFHAAHAAAGTRTVAVAGASGLIGRQLCALLSGGGHRVIRLVRRRAAAPDEIAWDPTGGVLDVEALRDVDAVVSLGGRFIGGRFTAEAKAEIRRSRVDTTGVLARALADLAADGRPRAFLCASGIGYYGPQPHGAQTDPAPLTEDAPSGPGFLAAVCRAWEAATDPAAHAGVRVVNVRTGLVQTPEEGPLARLLPLFAAGLGGPLDPGQWQSWISVDDIAAVYAHAALDDRLRGPLNAVGPEPVRGREYARTVGRVLHRPAALPVPRFGPRLVVGKEGAAELAYASQRVSADKLVAAGFRFRHRTLEAALRHVLP